MRLYIFLTLISSLTCASKLNHTPGNPSMALSKSSLENQVSVNPEVIGDDYDVDWDNCDYVNPSVLPDRVRPQDLLVLQWNLRGLRGKIDDIEDFLNNTLEQKVGVVMICETWLNNNSPPLPPVNGYVFVGKPRLDRKGGGVGFLIRKDLIYRRKSELEINSTVLENMIIEVKCQTNILMCSGYRPPNTNTTEFRNVYEDILNKMTNHKHTNSIIGIDHNLDFIKHNMHNPTQLYLMQNLDYNMIPTITRPTRITHTSATLIDNLFISQKLQENYKSSILISSISDHLPCCVVLPDATEHKISLQKMSFLRFNAKAKTNICNSIKAVNWEIELKQDDVNKAFSIFHTKLIESIDKFSPVITKTINPKKQPRAKWLTAGIINSINKNKELHRKSIKTNATLEDKCKYKWNNKVLNKVKRYAKLNYYSNKCEEIRKNGPKLWKLINKITNKTPNKQSIINKINIEGIIVERPKEIANALADYFAQIGSNLYSKLPSSKQPLKHYLNKIPTCPNTMFVTATTPLEINNIIIKLENKHSSGYDNISNHMLKWLRPVITEPLSIIFNLSIKQGIFPDCMKIAEIVPLHKGGDESLCNNYRPISLLITISKVLEKIIYKRTYSFLEKNNILFQSQYGFRSRHSCSDAIVELVGEIIKNRENGLYTAGIFLDLSKAFDTLPHNILLNKMHKYGTRGSINAWFSSYLESRSQRVKCNVASSNATIYSMEKPMDIGTPQGSCLGPLLFLLYNNDLYLHLEYTNVILFADDTTLYMGHRNLNYLRWCLEQDLSNINDWFLANKLTLNINKSCCVLFKKHKSSIALNIGINNNPLPQHTHVKFLGVWLDENLDWNCHCNSIINKIKRNTYLLRMGQNCMTRHALKLIYYSHIQSHIQYGLLVWGNECLPKNKKTIQNQLNKCIRLVKRGKIFNSKTKCNFLTLNQLIKLENWKLGYKLKNNELPCRISKIISHDKNKIALNKKHHYNTRNKNLLNIPKHSSVSYHKSFLVSCIRDFASLPSSVTTIQKFKPFVHKCKTILLTNT